jgi:uncharacterized membrane protein
MRRWIPLLIIFATFAFGAAVYDRLPERMPIHWNARGEVDGYGSRFWGTFGLPAFLVLIWGILRAVPYLDPRRENIEKFRGAYEDLIIAVIAIMSMIQVTAVGSALGWPIAVGRVVPAAIGVLFVFLGNLLPRFRSNFFLGIRTPWTLSSDTVWTKTHRFGGYFMVGVGFLLIIAGLTGSALWITIAITGGISLAVGVFLYSYLLWRGEQRRAD